MAGKMVSPVEIEKSLAGLDYPADKEGLISHARAQGAAADVLDILEQLPDGTYRSPADVSKAIGSLT